VLVKILNFGSNWWARSGQDAHDRYRFTRHAAYFNSTGLRSGNKVRRHWIVPGLIRFNGVGGFNPHFPDRALGKTFECTDLTFAYGGNRLLFVKNAEQMLAPDYYLVVLSSETRGAINFGDAGWKSDSAMPIAVSSSGYRQEAMLLMKPLDRVRTSLGVWRLKLGPNVRYGASLELVDERTFNGSFA
jgi:hypothetical protein